MTELTRDYELREWEKAPDLDNVWIRSTISYRGPVIVMNGTKPGAPEFSSRRFSVIDARSGIRFKVITINYTTPFNSYADYPIHVKYRDGECLDLMNIEYNGTLEQALTWNGAVQELEGFF